MAFFSKANTEPSSTDPKTDLLIRSGHCYVFYAFDIGLAIDLEKAASLIKEETARTKFRRDQKAPSYFEYDPPPLRINQQRDEIKILNFQTEPLTDITLYDFGAVSVGYTIHIEGRFADLIELSAELYDSARLREDSTERVLHLLAEIEPAVSRARPPGGYEEYAIFQIEEFETSVKLPQIVSENSRMIAQILRCEHEHFSPLETEDALGCSISYTTEDLTVIDWNAAMIFGRGADDVRAVLEFGNVELLEMRYLDEQLDDSLEEAYKTLGQRRGSEADLRRIGQLQVDGAILFEAVNNALKLLGDQYLARVYSLVAKRFHLADWDASILRKLDTLESIYSKMSDRNAQRRTEFLEWIIILLIAFEIVMTFVAPH